jgi:hypothetical protein
MRPAYSLGPAAQGLIRNTAMQLVLRRANASRKGGHWQDEDYDVFDVGRIYLVDSYGGNETWFWGVSFQLTGRKSYGHAPSLDEAKTAFKTEYAAWKNKLICPAAPWLEQCCCPMQRGIR